MYTFLVLTYNSEKFILETLESIRFQIEKYGKGRSFQLILADDCSTDRTREYLDEWTKRYAGLFAMITESYQKENVGTCKNLAAALRLIKGDLFFSIAGDDLLSFNDIFSILEKNKEADVLATVSLAITNHQISRKKHYYNDALAAATYSTDYIKWSVGLGNPIFAGAAWKKELNTEQVLTYMERYRLLDDRTRYYAIWHFEKTIQYKFINLSLMLYRKNEESVSSKKGAYVSVIEEDLIQFYKSSMKHSKSILYRFCAWAQLLSAKMRGKRGIWVIRYLTPYYIIEETRRLLHWRETNSFYSDLMEREYRTARRYLSYIQKAANEFKMKNK